MGVELGTKENGKLTVSATVAAAAAAAMPPVCPSCLAHLNEAFPAAINPAAA